MPAITLGLAEVEKRLRGLRRRLNAITAQHSVYLSLSAVVVALSGLIIVGLRGSTSAFRASLWGAVVLCLAAIVWGAAAARRRWLDVAATARLADQRAALTDRLVTLVDLRARPRPSRLAPVLIAQLLALSNKWQPQQIAPRRVPRSVYALLASLLALGSTAFIERRPPAPPPPAQSGAMTGTRTTTAPLNAPSVGVTGADTQGADGPSVPGMLQAGDLPRGPAPDGRGASGVGPPGAAQQGAPSNGAGQRGDRSRDLGSGFGGDQGSKEGNEQPGNVLTALPDQLQEAIRRAFHAEAMDRPQDLAARSDPSSRDPGATRDGQQPNPDRPRDASDAGKIDPRAQSPKSGAGSGTQKGAGQPKPGDQVAKREDGNSANPNFDGNSPAAGEGSSPGALMDGKGQSGGASNGSVKTFKLTISSFLHAIEQKGNQPRQGDKKASASGSAGGGTTAQVALNERQLNDDALRKAEIPPEYEDIVRRVYSLRADQ